MSNPTNAETLRRGQQIREARGRTGLTREQLAVSVGVSVSTIVRLENSYQLPNAESLARITAAVGISLDALLGGVQ